METQKIVLYPEQKPKNKFVWFGLSLQHVFAMFGATILVPRLVGLDPSIALLASGVGTLIYILVTSGKVPIYLGSSFAFIPLLKVIADSHGDVSSAMVGVLAVALTYLVFASMLAIFKFDITKRLLPPVVVGPMIMIIALSIAPVAVSEIGLSQESFSYQNLLIAAITVGSALCLMVANDFGKKIPFISQIPILSAIVIGYLSAMVLGVVDFSALEHANILSLPHIQVPFISYTPKVDFGIIIPMMIVSIVTITENIGEHAVLSEIVGRDFLKKPGIPRILAADGLAILFSGLAGGPVTTTYAENNGVIAITKIASTWITGGAAILAIMLSFSGTLSALIQTIPAPVLGGVSLILFGMIALNGMKILIRGNVNLESAKNLAIITTMLILGVGGATFKFSVFSQNIQLQSLAVAAVVGITMSLIIPDTKKEKEGHA
ncbi:MAG: uracil-xanthine permease family protein [Culicoidibacterales bacterium]